ncbi:MAG: hypothetical protein ACE5HI_20730, partial [bacterium]
PMMLRPLSWFLIEVIKPNAYYFCAACRRAAKGSERNSRNLQDVSLVFHPYCFKYRMGLTWRRCM